MKKEAGVTSESDEDLMIFLISLQEKYQYSSGQETVDHYLQRVYPHLSELNEEEQSFYGEVKSKLEKILQGFKK